MHGHGGSNAVFNLPGQSSQPSALAHHHQNPHHHGTGGGSKRSFHSNHEHGGHGRVRFDHLHGHKTISKNPTKIEFHHGHTSTTTTKTTAAKSRASLGRSIHRKDSRMGHRGEWDTPEKNIEHKRRAEERSRLEELTNAHKIETHLASKTHFTPEEIEGLIKMHKRLVSQGKMDRLRFRETMYTILEITDDLILDRMFASFDGDSQGSVSDTEWVLGLNAILRGSLDERIAYCYDVYDINGDRGIGRDELYQFLKNCISPLPGEGIQGIEQDEVFECCNDIIEIVIKKLDVDGNGTITYGDFYDAVQHDPLLLEALGQCIPHEKNMKTFLTLFANNNNNYSTQYSHPNDRGWDRERDKFNRKLEIAAKLKQEQKIHGTAPLLTFRERKKSQIGAASKNYGLSKMARAKRQY